MSIYREIFDFNNDNEMDLFEKTVEFSVLNKMMSSSDDADFNDEDFDEFDDEFDDEEDEDFDEFDDEDYDFQRENYIR